MSKFQFSDVDAKTTIDHEVCVTIEPFGKKPEQNEKIDYDVLKELRELEGKLRSFSEESTQPTALLENAMIERNGDTITISKRFKSTLDLKQLEKDFPTQIRTASGQQIAENHR